jgi:hypothetical protein
MTVAITSIIVVITRPFQAINTIPDSQSRHKSVSLLAAEAELHIGTDEGIPHGPWFEARTSS